jgi:hypothetical protein
MTRTSLLNICILVLVICAAVAGLLWWQIGKAEEQLVNLRSTLSQKQAEFANLNDMTTAQEKLDVLTLDERTSTQLDILKHLGLEQVDLNFTVNSRETRTVGDTNLIVRTVNLDVTQSYPEVQALIDQLYANGKLQIRGLELTPSEEEMPDPVTLRMEGMLYSLEKLGLPPSSTLPPPVVISPTATNPISATANMEVTP